MVQQNRLAFLLNVGCEVGRLVTPCTAELHGI